MDATASVVPDANAGKDGTEMKLRPDE